jgi:DNA-binding MarR family transcriptional regulator
MPLEEPESPIPALREVPVIALSRVGRHVHNVVKDAFDREGLSWRSHVVLLCLNERGQLSQRELANITTVDPSDLVRLLDEMERAGHVQRRPDPRDRRRHALAITPSGAKALRRGQQTLGKATDEILAPLTDTDRKALHNLVNLILGTPG